MDVELDFSDTSRSENPAVLIVEDNMEDIFTMQRILKKVSPKSSVEVTKTMRQTYNILKEKRFDIIFLDLNLPDGYGISTVKETRNLDRNAVIVVTTGMANDITIQEAKKAGAAAVFLKSQICNENIEAVFKHV